jgi:hypothetical protein
MSTTCRILSCIFNVYWILYKSLLYLDACVSPCLCRNRRQRNLHHNVRKAESLWPQISTLYTQSTSVCILSPQNLYTQPTSLCKHVTLWWDIKTLNPELNPICYLLALLGDHHFLHVSRIRVKSLTLRLLMPYIYIYGAPILDVSRSHTTTQHSQ